MSAKPSLADVLQEHWDEYARAHRSRLHHAHYRAVRRVLQCRTPFLGGSLYQCSPCQTRHFAYHSCNHRNCPQCGALDQQIWTAKQEANLLPVPYFLVTFTVPDSLRPLCLSAPKAIYGLLLKESAGALRDIVQSKTGADRIELTSVLHTWGRQMQHHPHVHCIVPAVGYDSQTGGLVDPKQPDEFLVPFRPLTERFRNRIRIALQTQHPELYRSLSSKAHQALSTKTTWNVQLQPAGTGKTAIRYLARYVHRSAFHPTRLLGYDKSGRIRLSWTCSQTGKKNVLALTPHEFIRRWLLHVLPKGFARIRHYGYLSSAALKVRKRIRWLLGCLEIAPAAILPKPEPFPCPNCGGDLQLVGRYSIQLTLHLRGPPYDG